MWQEVIVFAPMYLVGAVVALTMVWIVAGWAMWPIRKVRAYRRDRKGT